MYETGFMYSTMTAFCLCNWCTPSCSLPPLLRSPPPLSLSILHLPSLVERGHFHPLSSQSLHTSSWSIPPRPISEELQLCALAACSAHSLPAGAPRMTYNKSNITTAIYCALINLSAAACVWHLLYSDYALTIFVCLPSVFYCLSSVVF